MKQYSNIKSINFARQKGAVLLIFFVIVIVGSMTIFLSSAANKKPATKVNEKNAIALMRAKAALIGWAIGHPTIPGMLPWPDRNADGNYDGNSDCNSTQNPNVTLLTGKLPWLGQDASSGCIGVQTPLSALSVNIKDGTGQTLWYAVSPNLVYNYNAGSVPTITSETKSLTTGWLTVRNNLGNVLSDRVAFIVMAPGNVVSSQTRAGNSPGIAQYLDVGSSNSNANNDGTFVIENPAPTFNDSLIYITIDELVSHLETRIARELKICLDQYAANTNGSNNPQPGSYPLPIVLTGYNIGRFDPSINWATTCIINNTAVWPNWQLLSFYKVAPGYQPGSSTSCPTCLQLNSTGNYFSMVLLSGSALSGQQRSNATEQGNISNYLEAENATPADNNFESGPATSTFNDRVYCIDANTLCK